MSNSSMAQACQALRGHEHGLRLVHALRTYGGRLHIRLLLAAAHLERDDLYEALDEMVMLEELLVCDRALQQSELAASLERLWINR